MDGLSKKIERELQKVTGVKHRPGETVERYYRRLLRLSGRLRGEKWRSLADETQEFVNATRTKPVAGGKDGKEAGPGDVVLERIFDMVLHNATIKSTEISETLEKDGIKLSHHTIGPYRRSFLKALRHLKKRELLKVA